MTHHRVLKALVRAVTALDRVTHSARITSTMPDLAFGIAVNVCPRTAQAICSASSRLDLRSKCRASRLSQLTSTTRTACAVR